MTRAPSWFLPAGFLIGVAGALCGIGGGIFAGPLLHARGGLTLKRSAATALLVVLATTGAASVTEILRADNRIVLAVVVPLSVGALLGAELGYRASRRIAERPTKAVFMLVLFLAGLRVLFFSAGAGGGAALGLPATLFVSAAVGIGGGFLTPLLGIGGGIVMVPALFLLVGQLGFGGARACSLAAGALAAVRSLWLHARARGIDVALGLPLAAGALAGAVAGVLATRLAAFADSGRVLLAGLLIAQAVRFALDLQRAEAASR